MLEEVHHAQHEAAGLPLAAAAVAELAGGYRVRIDVEGRRVVVVVQQLHVTRVEQRPRRQAVAVRNFPLLRARVGAVHHVADGLAVCRAALAVLRLAEEQVELPGTDRYRTGHGPEVTRQVARRRVVLGLFVGRGEPQPEALEQRAEVPRTGYRPVVVVGVEGAGSSGRAIHAIDCARNRGVLPHLVVHFAADPELQRAVRVDDVAAPYP